MIGTETTKLTVSDVTEVLSNFRRREMIRLLSSEPPRLATQSELAKSIFEVEEDASSERSIYVSLYHTHLPLLCDLDIIECDDGEIRRDENFDLIRELLRDLDLRLGEDHL